MTRERRCRRAVSITVAAAEVAVGLALALAIHRRFKTLDVNALAEMRR